MMRERLDRTLGQRQAAESVVATQLDDHDGGSVPGEEPVQHREAAGRGLAGDAGVEYVVGAALLLQAPAQTLDPAALRFHLVSGTEAVPQHQYIAGRRPGHGNQNNKS